MTLKLNIDFLLNTGLIEENINTLRCKVRVKKLTAAQLIKKLPHLTRRFITVFTRARHWTLS